MSSKHSRENDGDIVLVGLVSFPQNFREGFEIRVAATDMALFAFVELFIVTRVTVFRHGGVSSGKRSRNA